MSTPQTYELGWFSYLSNILSPTGQKVGRGSKKFVPHFQNRGAAPASDHVAGYGLVSFSELRD